MALHRPSPLPSSRLRGGVLLVLAALFTSLPTASVHPAPELDQKQRQLEGLRQRIGSLQQKLEQAREAFDQAERDLARTERAIAATATDLRETGQRITTQQKELTRLESSHRQQQQALSSQRRQLAHQLRVVHAAGHQHRLKLMLNQQDPTLAGRMMVLRDYYQRASSETIRGISGELERLAASRQAVVAEKERLERSRRELAQQGESLEQQRRQRDRLVARLRGRVTAQDSELKRLRADEKRLTDLIASIRSAMVRVAPEPPPPKVDKRPFRKLRGELPWPTSGRLEIGYGATRQLGDFHWQGMVIAAPEGQEVRSVARGRVAYADWLRGYGMLLIIDHGGGYLTLYGYNRSLYRKVGDWVEAGSPIAQVGVSGGRERSALYFELRRNGDPVDPIRWLERRR